MAYRKQGAVWFRSSNFGDDKTGLLLGRTASLPILPSDIMYLINKSERGFDKIFYIWGADHHGYVDRLMATARALGLDDMEVIIIIGQLVKPGKKAGSWLRCPGGKARSTL